MASFKISLNNFQGGFAPRWWENNNPTFGNKNMAGNMKNIDLTDPTTLKQGSSLSNLVNGTDAGVVTTLIKSILDKSESSGISFALGGRKLYKISNDTVSSSSVWPRTLAQVNRTATSGEAIAHYQDNIYYSYIYTSAGSTKGDIGLYNTSTGAFDDDWGSSVPAGASTISGNPHPIEVGGDDILYVANGRYVTTYNGTTLTEKGLDLPIDFVIQDLKWTANRLWIAATRENLTGANKQLGSIFVWDGVASSWETEIKVLGEITALHIKNGNLFVFYTDISDGSGRCKVGLIDGISVREVASTKGACPRFYQVTDYKDYMAWADGRGSDTDTNSSGLIYVFGSPQPSQPAILFQLAPAGYLNDVGGLASPFGTPMITSDNNTNYRIARFSGIETSSQWVSMTFPIGEEQEAYLDNMIVNFDTIGAGGRANFDILYNAGVSAKSVGHITSTDGNRKVLPLNIPMVSDFSVKVKWLRGSVSNNAKIRNMIITGHTAATIGHK